VYPSSQTSNSHLLHADVLVAERKYYFLLKTNTIKLLQQFMNHSVMERIDYDNLLEQHCYHCFTLLTGSSPE
jgi:hypothetical protein